VKSHAELRSKLRSTLLRRMQEAGEEPANIIEAAVEKGFSQRTVEYPNS